MHKYGLWVKETTVTTGTGNITLAGAADGFASFSGQVANGVDVIYSIENGDNRELGVGQLSSGTTLQRLNVRATLVGGVFDGNAPAPITLTGTSDVMITEDKTLLEWAQALRESTGKEGWMPVVGGDGILALADEIDGGDF